MQVRERFQDYCFHLETDHEPLVSLFSAENFDDMQGRIQDLPRGVLRWND